VSRDRRLRAIVLALVVACVAAGPACSSGTGKTVQEVAVNVLTLQSGTVSELRDLRGTGPFLAYDVPPDEMMGIVEAVLRTKVVAVFPNPRAFEVVAKERLGAEAADDWYAPPSRSMVVVIVHPAAGGGPGSRVEIHAMDRGPFHRGHIAWERELPPLLNDAVRHRGSTPIRPLR